MTIVVGYPVNGRAKAVLSMAEMLARSSGEDLLICVVIPAPWTPGMARADQGYRSHINDSATNALARARDDVSPDITVNTTMVDARSAPSGLVEVAESSGASAIAVGSSDAGQFGYITLSSVADRLLHSSPVPVAVAPRGFKSAGCKVDRVSFAFTGRTESGVLLRAAETTAAAYGATLRLVSFAVQVSPPGAARYRAEDAELAAEWTANLRAAAHEALHPGSSPEHETPDADVVIGHGEDWKEALEDVEWHTGDVLIIGSSETGPIQRVFLGSRATKIIRHSPIPVLGIPREAAKEIVGE